MKISIERGTLLKALAQAQSVVERRNTIPILANVLIEADGAQASFRATDLDIEVVDRAPAMVERAGATTVSAVMLHEIVRKLPDGALVGVPNDPSNGGRALKVLEQLGLIKLNPDAGILATVIDVTENPKNLDLRELDAGVVGRAIDDLDAAVVNTDWAAKAGLLDHRIAQESRENNPYTNFIAVRTADKDAAWVAKLKQAFQTDAVKEAYASAYKGAAVTAW